MKKIAYILLLIGWCTTAPRQLSGQGWVRTFPRLLQPAGLYQTSDQGMVFVANAQLAGPLQQDIAVVKTAQDGKQQWLQQFGGSGNDLGYALDLAADGQSLVVTGEKGLSANSSDTWLARLSIDGRVIWEREYNLGVKDAGKGVRILPDSGLVLVADTEAGLRLLRLNSSGDTIWTRSFPQTAGMKAKSLELLPDQGCLITLLQNNLPLIAPIATVLRVDANGQQQFLQDFQHLSAYVSTDVAKAVPVSDTLYWLAHRDSVYRINAAGQQLNAVHLQASLDLYATDLLPAPDGGFWVLGTAYSLAAPPQSKIYFGRFSREGTPLWVRQIPAPSYLHAGWSMTRLENGGFVLSGTYRRDSRYFSYLLQTDSLGMSFTNVASGRVYWNRQQSCPDTSDILPLSGWVVKVQHPNGEIQYTSTDEQGYFNAPVGMGAHQLSLLLPGNWWQKNCAPDVSLTFDTTFSEKSAVLPVQAALNCPLPWVDIGADRQQACVEADWSLQYINRGTAPAPNAILTLQLDSMLQLLSAERPYQTLSNHRYRFELGDLAPQTLHNFKVRIKPDCNAETGRALCAEAIIEPAAPCETNNVPLIVVSGVCEGDSVRFRIQNLGGDMDGPQSYVIVEDNIVLFQGQYQLRSGQTQQHAVPGNGSTWRLEAQQAPGVSPLLSDPYVAAVVEACTASGAFSTGFLNQFSLYDGGFFRETDCQTLSVNRPAIEKEGVPLGYGAQHYVPVNTKLEYTLYVQNTGLDTVRAAVLLDTLDTGVLDAGSVLPGPSSHPYRWQLEGGGVLRMVFDNLALPPATTDSVNSRAWVNFSIAMQKDLPVGTVIRNTAATYLGYRPPVYSNESWHTIGVPLYSDPPARPTPPSALWSYPSPAFDAVTLQLKTPGQYRVTLCDISGRILLEKDFTGDLLVIPDEWLPSGVFVATVRSQGKRVGSTKIIKMNE